jgi:hypothetical protein
MNTTLRLPPAAADPPADDAGEAAALAATLGAAALAVGAVVGLGVAELPQAAITTDRAAMTPPSLRCWVENMSLGPPLLVGFLTMASSRQPAAAGLRELDRRPD